MIRRAFLYSTVLLASLWASLPAQAQVQIDNFSQADHNHMRQQVQSIETLVQMRMGTRLRGDLSDLSTLQTIIDRGLIEQGDMLRLQALGAVLGNVMEAEVEQLHWKIYEDEEGRSRALCIANTQHCLFPITMLSRRMTVGLKPNVQEIYDNAMELIAPYLPQLPYTGTDYN